MEKKEMPIEIYNTNGDYLSNCSKKRAAQLTFRQKGEWIGPNQLRLFYTWQEEKEIRKRVRERDQDTCYLCDRKLAADEITYDHITPRSQGGTDLEDNLAICCRDCNEDKADRSLEQYFIYSVFRLTKLMYQFKIGRH